MKTWFLQILDRVRTSLWFLPACMGLVAVALGVFLPRFNLELQFKEGEILSRWFDVTHDQAKLILSTISGALVTVAGTVFSITMVSLSVSAQQFGSRLLRAYIRDRSTQFSIGCLLSTALYSFLVLRSIKEGLPVPVIAVLLALALVVLSMAMLIFFVHHVAHIIQAPAVVAMVFEDLNISIKATFPDEKGAKKERARVLEIEAGKLETGDRFEIECGVEGYIQALDYQTIVEYAAKENVVMQMRFRPGDFCWKGDPLLTVYGKTEMGKKSLKKIRSTVSTGNRRTTVQDVECGINEIVEVAIRALSPGINDPFTALNCLDYLGASLSRVTERGAQPRYLLDENDKLRLVIRTFTMDGLIDAAFNQIRQYGRASVAVTIRILEVIASLLPQDLDDDARKALYRHAELAVENLTMHASGDREDILRRFADVQAAMRL